MNKEEFHISSQKRSNKEMDEIDKILSEKEKEILLLIAQGYLSSQIARILNLSKNSVNIYKTDLWKKLEVPGLPVLHQTAIDYYTWYTKTKAV